MKDEQIRAQIHQAVDAHGEHLRTDPFLAQRIMNQERTGEPVVKKRLSVGLVLAIVLMLVAVTALAAGIIYNLGWYYTNRDNYLRDNNPTVYEAIMSNVIENPEQEQSSNNLVDVTIQDVSWSPEVKKLTISFRASVNDPDHFEMHGMWALDTDGAYIGEGGSTTVTDDSEDRAMHWLWRSFETEGNEGPGCYGPPFEMMDDGSKRLLLIERNGITLFDGTIPMDVSGSMDMFRTPEGDIVFVEEIDLEWLSEDYDQRMAEYANQNPDMKEYAESRVTNAQAIRENLKDGMIPVRLIYSVVEYTEGMDDLELYTGGEQGYVDFVIRPKQTKP